MNSASLPNPSFQRDARKLHGSLLEPAQLLAGCVWKIPASLYIHVPFCTNRCGYCDFHSLEAGRCSEGTFDSYIDALKRQHDFWVSMLGIEAYRTIYIGGGTPSVLGSATLARLLAYFSRFSTSEIEWTIEANPESVDPAMLAMVRDHGVTRLSLGIQTFSPEKRRMLERAGNPYKAVDLIRSAHSCGLDVSVDLLAGLPHRSGDPDDCISTTLQDILTVADKVDHISLYDLTVEEGTRLARHVENGQLALPDDDTLKELRDAADTLLSQHGFMRYEISNYARPGRECRHNAGYWDAESYLGIGSGAVSTLLACTSDEPERVLNGLRFTGTRDLALYMEYPEAIDGENMEHLAPATLAFEMLMLGCRTRRGVSLSRYRQRFGKDISDEIPKTLERWKDHLIWEEERLALDRASMDILNRFLVDCMSEMEGGML